MIRFEIVKGNIIEQDADVIVTEANQELKGGTGLNGAVHVAGGKGLLEECKELKGCSTGKAKLTRSYDLVERGTPWIIHAVGPRYAGGMYFEADLLADVYESVLAISKDYKAIYEAQCLQVLNNYIGHLEPNQKRPYIEETVDEVRDYVKAHPIRTVAIPSISTGVYGYPLKEGAYIATKIIKNFCSKNNHLDKITMVCCDDETYKMYMKFN